MSRIMRCRDVGADCDFIAEGQNDEEIIAKVTQHAREAHGYPDIPPDMVAKVRAAIHEKEAAAA